MSSCRRKPTLSKRLNNSEQEPHRPPVRTDVVVDDDDGLQKSEGHCGRSSSLQYRLRLVARFILSCALPCLALASLHVGLPKKKLPLFFSQTTSPVDSSTRCPLDPPDAGRQLASLYQDATWFGYHYEPLCIDYNVHCISHGLCHVSTL